MHLKMSEFYDLLFESNTWILLKNPGWPDTAREPDSLPPFLSRRFMGTTMYVLYYLTSPVPLISLTLSLCITAALLLRKVVMFAFLCPSRPSPNGTASREASLMR